MSSVTIIISIIALLAALLCYAFLMQTITQKRQQKARLLSGLKTRSRNFKYMLNGFPKGFLPKELTLLVQRSLLHVSEQLAKLDPKDPSHRKDFLAISQQMVETQAQAAVKVTHAAIDNPQQSKEIKSCLEELYKFVFHLEGNRELTRPQADIHRAMIKHLVLQLTVDSYALHGRIAKDKAKPQLALHYFNLGLKLMMKEKNKGHFEGRISQLNTAISNLEEQLAAEGTAGKQATETASTRQNAKSEWDQYEQGENHWKKKQIYD